MVSGRSLAAFRFFQFIPYGVLGFYGASTFQDLRTHPAALKSPYSPNIAAGQGLAAILGWLGFAWNFFSYLPMAALGGKRGCLFISAAVDFVLASGLLIAFVLQTTYLPRPLGQCHNARDWIPVGSNRSIFAVVTMNNSTSTPNNSMIVSECRGYMTVWACEIPMFFLSFVAAWIALRAAGIAPDVVGIFLQHTLPPIRFIKGLRIKHQRHRLHQRAIALKLTAASSSGREAEWTVGRSPLEEKQAQANTTAFELTPVARAATDEGATTLNKILSYPVLAIIAENSHYGDILNLMLASKSVHNAFLRSAGSRSTALRTKTCEDASKTECWCCRCQICDLCKQQLIISPIETDHTSRCHVYCSKCYYTSNCHVKCRYFKKASSCCHQRCRVRNTSFSAKSDLCNACYSLPYDDIVRKQVEREKASMAHRAELALKCAGCQATLSKNGPRWWNCNVCKKECTSDIHPAWAGDGSVA